MAKLVKQIIVADDDILKNIVQNYAPVVKLGIQAPAGTTFQINETNSDITIGRHRIYELDLTYLHGYIYSLVFTNRGSDGYADNSILVDIVYEGVAQI